MDAVSVGASLGSDARGVDSLLFADGTVWDLATLRVEILNRAATSNSETIWGFDGADILFGGAGDDTLIGGDGSDLYRFGIGDGHDIIDDNGNGDTDTLEILGYSSLEVSVERYFLGDDGIVLTFAGSTTDSVTILNTLSGNAADTIEVIRFSDGVEWQVDDILPLLTNNRPVAERDGFFSAVQGTPSVILAEALLLNDFDPDGDELTVLSVSNAQNGTVQLDANGNVVFTANDGFTGITTFDYTVSDSNNGLATETVSIRCLLYTSPSPRDRG